MYQGKLNPYLWQLTRKIKIVIVDVVVIIVIIQFDPGITLSQKSAVHRTCRNATLIRLPKSMRVKKRTQYLIRYPLFAY